MQGNGDVTHEFAVGGDQGKPFLVQRICDMYGAEYLVIDGVRCTPEVLRKLFVSPSPDRLVRFERDGETLLAHSYAVEAVEIDDAEVE